MNISVLSVLPELYKPFLETSIIARAQQQKLISFDIKSFFAFVQPKEHIDAPTFGHGSGMLIRPDVIEKGIKEQEMQFGKAFKIFFSPQGKKLTQPLLQELSKQLLPQSHILLVATRYEGTDARVEEEYADLVLSIGDYVLMGGDIPAMAFIEGFTRLLPDVVGKQESVEHESFSSAFVDYPEYTQPVMWHYKIVPEVVRSGNHAAQQQWRLEQAAQKTILHHFGWLRSSAMTQEEKKVAASYIPPHYVALMHTDVLLPDKKVGTTSVTSLDIHDIARSAKTFGIKNYFLVTPLQDQQQIVQTLLDFWQTGTGVEYNPQRHEALEQVKLVDNLTAVISTIEQQEGKKPIIIATSARKEQVTQMISYYDQELIWQQQRPVLFIFGTGKGLSRNLLEQCDYLLGPISGFSDFNHLSVRSAASIVFDRWFGINPRSQVKIKI